MYNFNSNFLYCNDREMNLCKNSYLALEKIDYGPFSLNPYCAKCLNKTQSFWPRGCEIFTTVDSTIYYKAPISPQTIVSFDDKANPVFQYITNFRFCEDGYQYEIFKGRWIKKYFLKVRTKEQNNNRSKLIKEIYDVMINFSFNYTKLELKDSVLDKYYCNIHGTCCIDAFFDESFIPLLNI